MATDSLARILAFAALEGGGGGGGGRGIDDAYIKDKHLFLVYSDGTTVDVGEVVGAPGADGKVYVPHIDAHKVLSWTVEDKEGEIPEPTDLDPFDEWEPIPEDETDYIWEDI